MPQGSNSDFSEWTMVRRQNIRQKTEPEWRPVHHHHHQQNEQTQSSMCYYPDCNNPVAVSLRSQKQLMACKDHLSTYYTKCTKCIINDRVKDSKTQRTFLFCSDCYKEYLKSQQNKPDQKCDRCKINVCSEDHRICRSCRREWRTMCVTCRQSKRLDDKYHCQQCFDKYQSHGCKAMIWINDFTGRKQCWSIASDGSDYCERCSKYGICKTEQCTNLSATNYCLECQEVCKEITNYIPPTTNNVFNRKICVFCRDFDKAPGEIHCGRWTCIAKLDTKVPDISYHFFSGFR